MMMRYLLWWTTAFLASFTTMAIVDALTDSPADTPDQVQARGFDSDGIELVIEPSGDGTAGRASEIDNSPGVSVETAKGDGLGQPDDTDESDSLGQSGNGEQSDSPEESNESGQPGSDSPGAPAAFSLVATANGPSVIARTEPSTDAPVLGQFANPITSGAPLVFQVERSGTTSSAKWIEVKLPIQPNGTTGWIPRADVDLVDNPYRIEIDRATYILRVFDQNEMFVETTIAIGNGATPTPVGDFYLTELLAPPDPGGIYGPFAFGLSGFSETLASFGGADVAIIGLHGTNDPSSLGNDVSHGCVRIANDVITELAETLPLGTPVLIT